MTKHFLVIFFSLLVSNSLLAQDINIQENIDLKFICDLEKKIIKNSEYNYQTFLAKDLNEKGLEKFEIKSKQPETLFINGLTSFLSDSKKLNVKVVNKDVILFKSIDLYLSKILISSWSFFINEVSSPFWQEKNSIDKKKISLFNLRIYVNYLLKF